MDEVDTIVAMIASCHLRTRLAVAPLLLAVIPLVFCACAPTGTGSLGTAINDYHAGRYEDAYRLASAARGGASRMERSEASYVAGLAAARLGRTADARRLLTQAATSSDDTISGKANVSLGTVLLEDNEPLSAARAFDRASHQLFGAESSRARYLAGIAYRDAGHALEARRRFNDAALSGSDELAPQAMSAINATGFAVQAGVYGDRSNAERCARECSEQAVRAGLGTARIIPIQRQGRTFYAVQVGSFATRVDAEAARRRLGEISGTLTRVERIAIADQ